METGSFIAYLAVITIVNCAIVVIDNGSGVMSVGFAGNVEPTARFPAVVGVVQFGGSEIYVGQEALKRGGILTIKHPNENGYILNFDYMEEIWKYAFNTKLQVPSVGNQVILTENIFNAVSMREQTKNVMLNNLYVSGVCVVNDGEMALKALDKTTGVVVNIEDGITQIIPIYQSSVQLTATKSTDLGVSAVATYFSQLFTIKHDYSLAGPGITRNIFDETGYIALDYNEELAKNIADVEYIMLDGEPVGIGDERFKAPEALFQPSLVGIQNEGIANMVKTAVEACNAQYHDDLYANIVLAGPGSIIPGIKERLEKDVKELVSGKSIVVIADENRRDLVFKGASKYAVSAQFESSAHGEEHVNFIDGLLKPDNGDSNGFKGYSKMDIVMVFILGVMVGVIFTLLMNVIICLKAKLAKYPYNMVEKQEQIDDE